MPRDENIVRAIQQRDIGSIGRLMFEPGGPVLKPGFRLETELWDFKAGCPAASKSPQHIAAWARIAIDVLAFHNHRGGLLVFGISNDFSFCGTRDRLDSKLVNDQIRRFLGDRIWVEFHREYIQPDQSYLGILLIPPRGPSIVRFAQEGRDIQGELLFEPGDAAMREGDSTRLLRRPDADQLARSLAAASVGQVYAVDDDFFRILQPEYMDFVERPDPCRRIEEALRDPRAAVTAVLGIGGMGKTALATWAVLRAHERQDFEFIVSMTAKDRELTTAGIAALDPGLTSYESLLDNVLEVLGFPDLKVAGVDTKEREIRRLLENSNGLLYVDNLETVDDLRIVQFLDSLPIGSRALVTSRRASVRVSVHPIDLGPLTPAETVAFIRSFARHPGFSYVLGLSQADCEKIGEACDGIALAVRWALARSRSPEEALLNAEGITQSGHRGEELLEFCFRRVFEQLPGPERSVLEVLSLFQQPTPPETLIVGARLPPFKVTDAMEALVGDSLIQRLFDPDRNDYSYVVLPIARAFVYHEVRNQPELERRIRNSLADYFEARDIKDPNERLVTREVRQGRSGAEVPMLDLAKSAERRGDFQSARSLYEQALSRNPRSWRAARQLAELHRHKLDNTAEALRLYEQAAASAPSLGRDRGLIYREWGMILRASGEPEATERAIEKFEIAREAMPDDAVTAHALAHMISRQGQYRRVVELLEPLAQHHSDVTRRKTLPLLLQAYERVGEILKAAELRPKVEALRSEE